MLNKIAFVIPYFGKLPSYFPLFVNSIKEKPFDIIFFTDIKKPDYLPENVVWSAFTFPELQTLFSKKTELEIKITNPYKLCDFKPTYGLCFEDYLKEYDFWGSLDIDTIVGDFEKFVYDKKLKDIDIFSGIKEYVSGAFFMVRNNSYCNNLFKKSKDWKEILLESQYKAFDECGGHYFEQLKAGQSIFNLNMPIESFTEIIFREKLNGLRIHFENDILEPKGSDYVIIDTKGVHYNQNEYLLLHYIHFKTRYYFYINTSLPKRDTYYFNSLGLFNNRPSKYVMLFSRNMAHAIIKKVRINLKKINFKNR